MLSFRDIARIFEEIELRLIASLKRNLSRHKAEEEKEGFEWSAWQAEKLNNIDNFRKENAQIADEYVDVIDDETRQLMTDQFHEGEHTAEQSVIDVSESGVNVPDVPAQPQPPEAPTAIPDDHFFGVNKPKMDKLMEDVTTLEKTALTAAVRNMDDVYRTTLNKVQLMMGTGSITLNEAIDLATRDFLDKGINCIVYADGRRVNIADYVRMALRTTSTRATLQGAAKRFAELGYDTVLISQYGGCSETCEPYQGKVYIDDVFTIWNGEKSGDFGKSNYCDKWFMLLSVAIRGGLFHPNCRHTMGQYIEGLTKIPQPIPAEKIREQRELEEKQRAMERKIRALKRKVEGTQDEKKVKEYKRKLREEQGKLREFIKEHDDVLRRDYSREKIYSGKGEPKQTTPRTEEAPVKVTDTESKNPVPTNKEPNIPQPDNNISEPENNVSKPENNENTMNFVQSEPIKPVQSNEDTDDTPTAVVSDEAVETVETAKTTENVQETVKQPVEATADSEEDVQNFTDDTVDNSDESDIIDIERSMAAKSFDKATKYARKELKISISSLSELPLETVNAINSSMHRLYQEIPVLKGSVSEVVLEDMAEIAKASVSWLDGTTPRIRIKINSLLFQSGSIGEIEQHIAQIAINHEITPKDGIYGLLLHESVHIREYLITAKKCSSLAEFKLSLDSFEEAKSIMNTALANCGLLSDTRVCERFLSEYATENPAEFIAEAFSSTENNDLVLEVKRLLKKKWGM